VFIEAIHFYGSMDFVRDNPGEPVPEETFTHSHLSWSSIVPYLLPPSTTVQSMASSLFNPCSWQSYSTISLQFSLVYLLAWHPPLHRLPHSCLHPIIVFFSQHMPILFRCSIEIMSSNPSPSPNPLQCTWMEINWLVRRFELELKSGQSSASLSV